MKAGAMRCSISVNFWLGVASTKVFTARSNVATQAREFGKVSGHQKRVVVCAIWVNNKSRFIGKMLSQKSLAP